MDAGKETSSSNSTGSGFGMNSFDFVKAASSVPVKFYSGLYRGGLDATARLLQQQADYLHQLSTIDQPAEMMAAHGDHVRKVLAGWADEGRRIFERGMADLKPEA